MPELHPDFEQSLPKLAEKLSNPRMEMYTVPDELLPHSPDFEFPPIIKAYHEAYVKLRLLENEESCLMNNRNINPIPLEHELRNRRLVQDFGPFEYAMVNTQMTPGGFEWMDHFFDDNKNLDWFMKTYGLRGIPGVSHSEKLQYLKENQRVITDMVLLSDWIDEQKTELKILKKYALSVNSLRINLWAMGVPWELARDYTPSGNPIKKVPALRYLLEKCIGGVDIDANVNQLERIIQPQVAAALVDQLILEDPEKNSSQLFQNACARVRLDELAPESQNWFREKGIVELQDESFYVHNRLPTSEYLTPCHEIGYFLTSERSDIIDTRFFETNDPLFPTSEHPRGSLLLVNYLDRFRLALASSFITSSNPFSRGILIPYDYGDHPHMYYYKKNSFQNGSRDAKFSIPQRGIEHSSAVELARIVDWMRGDDTLKLREGYQSK